MQATYQAGYLIKDEYKIIGILGQGGSAITYEAISVKENRTVALKALSLRQAEDWKLIELFEREAKVLKQLNHDRIPQYIDYFTIDTESDRQFFLAQELIAGKSLATLVEQGWRFQESEGCTLLYLLTRQSPSELPLQRMRIDFRSKLNLGKQFADWLDLILAPAVEDRFTSTQEALDKLNSETSLSIKAPSGSAIVVKKNSNSLIFDIPPNKTPDIKDCLIYLVIMLGISIIFLTQRNTKDAQILWFILPVHAVVWTSIFGYKIIYPLILNLKIFIKRDAFIIAHDYKILKRKEHEATNKISRVAIDHRINKKSGEVIGEYCSIEAGIKRYKFGEHLSLPEKRWLVEEIRQFLREEIDPYKRFT
ncbi:MAG: hypothetical protein AAFO95_12025 [Cyanobacteria bacterium J06600_6]